MPLHITTPTPTIFEVSRSCWQNMQLIKRQRRWPQESPGATQFATPPLNPPFLASPAFHWLLVTPTVTVQSLPSPKRHLGFLKFRKHNPLHCASQCSEGQEQKGYTIFISERLRKFPVPCCKQWKWIAIFLQSRHKYRLYRGNVEFEGQITSFS